MSTKPAKKAPAEQAHSLISSSKLQQLYATMLKCRILSSQNKGSFWKGKEGATVAATIDLQPQDALILPSGAVIANFLRGIPLSSIFRQSRETASSNGRKKPGAAITGAMAESALATGIAYAHSANNKESVTVAFLSEDPEGSAAGRESLLFAGTHKLPILYVYSGKSIDAPQMYAYGFPAILVDGNDVVAVYRVVYECMTRARQGKGPSLIACSFLPSNGSAARSADPIHKMEKYLSSKELFRKEKKQLIVRTFENEVARATVAAGKPLRRSEAEQESQNIFTL